MSNVNQYERGGGSGVLKIRRVGMHYSEGGKDHTVPKKTAAGRSGRLRGV